MKHRKFCHLPAHRGLLPTGSPADFPLQLGRAQIAGKLEAAAASSVGDLRIIMRCTMTMTMLAALLYLFSSLLPVLIQDARTAEVHDLVLRNVPRDAAKMIHHHVRDPESRWIVNLCVDEVSLIHSMSRQQPNTFQEPPQLGNGWQADPALQGIIHRLLPANVFSSVEPDIDRWAGRYVFLLSSRAVLL